MPPRCPRPSPRWRRRGWTIAWPPGPSSRYTSPTGPRSIPSCGNRSGGAIRSGSPRSPAPTRFRLRLERDVRAGTLDPAHPELDAGAVALVARNERAVIGEPVHDPLREGLGGVLEQDVIVGELLQGVDVFRPPLTPGGEDDRRILSLDPGEFVAGGAVLLQVPRRGQEQILRGRGPDLLHLGVLVDPAPPASLHELELGEVHPRLHVRGLGPGGIGLLSEWLGMDGRVGASLGGERGGREGAREGEHEGNPHSSLTMFHPGLWCPGGRCLLWTSACPSGHTRSGGIPLLRRRAGPDPAAA